MKKLLPFALALSLLGCAFHQAPYVAHGPGIPSTETSVFSVIAANPARDGALEITHVNGTPTSCAQAGCPVWVRVAPGKHTFTLRFNGDYKLEPGFIKWKTAVLTAEVDDMKPRHVYFGQQEFTPERVSLRVRDLGERPNHGIALGLEGANRKYFPVTF
jgi:hypothetical protein